MQNEKLQCEFKLAHRTWTEFVKFKIIVDNFAGKEAAKKMKADLCALIIYSNEEWIIINTSASHLHFPVFLFLYARACGCVVCFFPTVFIFRTKLQRLNKRRVNASRLRARR